MSGKETLPRSYELCFLNIVFHRCCLNLKFWPFLAVTLKQGEGSSFNRKPHEFLCSVVEVFSCMQVPGKTFGSFELHSRSLCSVFTRSYDSYDSIASYCSYGRWFTYPEGIVLIICIWCTKWDSLDVAFQTRFQARFVQGFFRNSLMQPAKCCGSRP